MPPRLSPVSAAEMVVLKALWKCGQATVRELQASAGSRAKRRWAYTTVLTLLQRLAAKGYVVGEKRGIAHVYRAVVSRSQLVRRRLRELTDEMCGGKAAPLVVALVEDHRFSPEEIEEFRQLLDRLGRR